VLGVKIYSVASEWKVCIQPRRSLSDSVRMTQKQIQARCHHNATWMKVLARKVWFLVTRMTQKQKRYRITDPTRCSSTAAAQKPDTQHVVCCSPSRPILTGSNQLCRPMRPEQHGIATFKKHHPVHELAVDAHRVKELGEGWCE